MSNSRDDDPTGGPPGSDDPLLGDRAVTIVDRSLPERLADEQTDPEPLTDGTPFTDEAALAELLRGEAVAEPVPLSAAVPMEAEDTDPSLLPGGPGTADEAAAANGAEVAAEKESDEEAEAGDQRTQIELPDGDEPTLRDVAAVGVEPEVVELEEIPEEERLTEVIRRVDEPASADGRGYRRAVIFLLTIIALVSLLNSAILMLVVEPWEKLGGAATEVETGEAAAEEPVIPLPEVESVADPETKPTPRPVVRRAPTPPPAEPTPPPPPPDASSTLTLLAKGSGSAASTIEAKVYIDGVLVGNAPVRDHPVVPGRRRIRFDCIFEGKTHRGTDKVLDLPPDTEAVIDHTCDVWVLPE